MPSGASRFVQKKLTEYVYPKLRKNLFFGPNMKKLKGYVPVTWRYRIVKFRVFFMVDHAEQVVFMLSVDDRRDTYRQGLKDLGIGGLRD